LEGSKLIRFFPVKLAFSFPLRVPSFRLRARSLLDYVPIIAGNSAKLVQSLVLDVNKIH